MNGHPSSRLSQWWVKGIDAADRHRPFLFHHAAQAVQLGATRSEVSAALLSRVLRWAGACLHRRRAADEPQTTLELLDLARRVESNMPNLAAEWRAMALCRPEAPD
jgi:hypothetical protein